MPIKQINLSDSDFNNCLMSFFYLSNPYDLKKGSSLSSIEASKRVLFDDIGHFDFGICHYEDDGTPSLYSFFSISEGGDSIYLNYIFPNTNFPPNRNIKKYKIAFCKSFLYIYEKTGLSLVKADIRRKNRVSSFIKLIDRFLPPVDLFKNENGEMSLVRIEKEKVLDFYEKM